MSGAERAGFDSSTRDHEHLSLAVALGRLNHSARTSKPASAICINTNTAPREHGRVHPQPRYLPASCMPPPPSLLGGVGLALSAHSLLALNGRVFGISGFMHRAVKGVEEDILGIAGLVLGGLIVGQLEGVPPPINRQGLGRLVLSGLLVGIGTKVRPAYKLFGVNLS
jgi:hypothetical protein